MMFVIGRESQEVRKEIQTLWQKMKGVFESIAKEAKEKGREIEKHIHIAIGEVACFAESARTIEAKRETAKKLSDLEPAGAGLEYKQRLSQEYSEAYAMGQVVEEAEAAQAELVRKHGDTVSRLKLQLAELAEYAKEKYQEYLENFPLNLTKTTETLAENLGDFFYTLSTGAKSAKEAFADFAESFLEDMTRMISQALAWYTVQGMLGGVGLLFGFASGGLLPGQFTPIRQFSSGGLLPGPFLPLTPMRYGGVYSRPTLGLIAEAGIPEAVVPLKQGKIPVRFEGTQGEAQRPMYIVNAFSEEFVRQQVNRALAENAEVILNVVQEDIASGGAMYRLVRGLRY